MLASDSDLYMNYEKAQEFRSTLNHYGLSPDKLKDQLMKDFAMKKSYFDLVKESIPHNEQMDLQIDLNYSEALLNLVKTACLV
jgi:hypothetical protein